MTDRPPALSQDLVDRLKGWVAGEAPAARAGRRALRMVGRPARRAVVKLVDPALQETLDQLRREAAAERSAASATTASSDVEVLRAELRTTHEALVDLSRRFDKMERALNDL